MQWTTNARRAAERANTEHNGDLVEQAILTAEQLAEQVQSSFVDADHWHQALNMVARARRLARHHPPAHHHDINL